MTICYAEPRPTRSLIHDHEPKFYQTKIPCQHPQLKNYISATNGDLIYYASNCEIYSLHLRTSGRRLVKSLKWKPFCLDAACGWICVGGEHKGQCAFIEIEYTDRDANPATLPAHQRTEVDDLLALNLDPQPRALSHRRSSAPLLPSSYPPKYTLHEYQIGDDIVNSVVIQCLPGGQEGLEDHIVAVLTNNDRTVRIFSLTRQYMLACPEDYPSAMNHATLSPCGNLLIAVGDEPQVFFSRRVFIQTKCGDRSSWDYEWQTVCEPKLRLVSPDDSCFATAFSPSGHMCAAATQKGVVTIFNTALIDAELDPDAAVVAVLPSTRVSFSSFRGAVRSMKFSPSPWDLFVFAEDQARVVVVDLRRECMSAQTLHLDSDEIVLNRMVVQDDESTFVQRRRDIEHRYLQSHEEHLAARNHFAAVTNTADFMEYAANRRRREQEAGNSRGIAFGSNPHQLTDSERRLIDAQGRRPAAATNVDPPTPISVNYSSSTNRFLVPSVPEWHAASATTSNTSNQTSIAEYMRLRTSDRPQQSGERSYQPRRRNSVIINPSSSSDPTSLAPIVTGTAQLSTSPSRLPTTSTTQSTFADLEEPWHTISAAIGSNTAALEQLRRSTQVTAATTQEVTPRTQLDRDDLSSQRSRLGRLEGLTTRDGQQLAPQQRAYNLLNAQRLTQLRPPPVRIESESEDALIVRLRGVATTGVDWSPDGRHLYVGSEEGIFEYKVNTALRKQFPGMCWI